MQVLEQQQKYDMHLEQGNDLGIGLQQLKLDEP